MSSMGNDNNAGGSSNNNSPSATDIITYIGVPLAVLGVLPILYNTTVTLLALSRIKRMLRHSRLTALTLSDVVNRVIEIELPRYAVTPWDRHEHRAEYWTLCPYPSSIPGGSWTTFNWRTNAIGIKTQRVQYADQLRQPQVDVAFDELVSYLLDLGAVPDAHGWKLLRSTGLWTPVGCALMKSPDGHHAALTVAPLDDSDGHLSLAVSWSSSWTQRDHVSLPPYWVRLPPPPPPEPEPEPEPEPDPKPQAEGDEVEGATANQPAGEKDEQKASSDADRPKTAGSSTSRVDSVQREAESNARRPITCQISVDGLVQALAQDAKVTGSGGPASLSATPSSSLYVEHLKRRMGRTDGTWFASAVTAYGTTSQTILWNYKIPDDVLAFARRETVPCGVLELLHVVDASATPEWETRHDDNGANLDAFVRRNREQREAMQAEAMMPPAQREQARQARIRRENQQRIDDMQDKMRLDRQRQEARQMEAIHSPKWDTSLVAEHNLRWLKDRKHVHHSLALKDAAGVLLHRMVLDGQLAASVCRLLDLWRAWADNGGMRRSDLDALRDDTLHFALASLLVAVIGDTAAAAEGTLAVDLQDCLRLWKVVRLG